MNNFDELSSKALHLWTHRYDASMATYNGSLLIARLRAEMKYFPPARRSFPSMARQAMEAAAERAERAAAPARERERLRTRREEMSVLADAQQQLLDETTPYTDPEAVAGIMQRLQALLHLLALADIRLEEQQPETAAEGPRLPMTHDEALEAEVSKLCLWRARLADERARIKESVDGDGNSADAYLDEVVAVTVGLSLADENLGLAPQPLSSLFDGRARAAADELARRTTQLINASRNPVR